MMGGCENDYLKGGIFGIWLPAQWCKVVAVGYALSKKYDWVIFLDSGPCYNPPTLVLMQLHDFTAARHCTH